MLNDRLALLTAEGVLDRVPYQDNPTRHEYRLTTRGQALCPVLLNMMSWGDAYQTDTPPVVLTHTPCGHPAAPAMTCSHCGEPVRWRETTAQYQPTAW